MGDNHLLFTKMIHFFSWVGGVGEGSGWGGGGGG